ncbi:MAG: hypothetical protein KBS56_01490 [Clostridiales bacterium]|nr:hypothetical protein [Candidatus Crickella equi]
MSRLFLGIDTSNYKTSLSIVDENANIVFNKSEYLDVKQGERGLRQSDAFFKQSNNLPVFVREAFETVKASDIAAIGVSTRPRRVEVSYMPCFLAGHNLAKELGSALDIPVYEFSHQEGHVKSGRSISDDNDNSGTVLSGFFHLSGGTTEFLLCEADNQGYNLEIVGGTKDISMGQLLDRIGVELGYSFPSGMYLDKIALESKSSSSIIPKIKIDDGFFNLSGVETKLTRYLQEGHTEEEINSMIAELFNKIAKLLIDSADYLINKYKIDTVYMAGGVASSQAIRKLIDRPYIRFGKPELSGDNAVGIAMLALNQYKK